MPLQRSTNAPFSYILNSFSLQTLTHTSDDDKNQQRLSPSGAKKSIKIIFQYLLFSLTTKRKSRCRHRGVRQRMCTKLYLYVNLAQFRLPKRFSFSIIIFSYMTCFHTIVNFPHQKLIIKLTSNGTEKSVYIYMFWGKMYQCDCH